MMLMLLALLIILIVAGAGFALHVLWWVAIAALVIWLVGFFLRRVSPAITGYHSARPGRPRTR